MEQPVKRRHHCPVCGSHELTRLGHGWRDRLVAWFVGAHKFRCFICGHQFVGHERIASESTRERD